GKSQLYEGGIRVPLIVRWPARMAGGRTSDAPTMNTDFYPTLLAAAGMKADPGQKQDGVSVLPTWENPESGPKREFLAWHYPLDRPHFLGGVSAGAIRSGHWKLIERFDTSENELFHLTDDPSEANNVAAQNPEVVSRLKKKLAAWRREMGTSIPKNQEVP
ncbi:MAG: sulfatase/phosphatase domain-containing protein, partial [Verrucomicrobiota bacterium]